MNQNDFPSFQDRREQEFSAQAPSSFDEPLMLENGGHTYPIRMMIETYCTYNNLAVGRDAFINGVWTPWDTLTVNLTPRFRGPNYALIDINNCGKNCLDWLVKHGFGCRTGFEERSGFCEYPEFAFSEDKLYQINADKYEEHIQLWEAYHSTQWPRRFAGHFQESE